MGFYLTALEAGTEGITAEEVSDTIEQMKKPGVVRTYLEGLVPDLLAFLFQVVIACVVYAIGVKLIKLSGNSSGNGWIKRMLTRV